MYLFIFSSSPTADEMQRDLHIFHHMVGVKTCFSFFAAIIYGSQENPDDAQICTKLENDNVSDFNLYHDNCEVALKIRK